MGASKGNVFYGQDGNALVVFEEIKDSTAT